MKKCTLFMFTGLLCICSLVGCGKGESSNDSTSGDTKTSVETEKQEESEETVNPNYTVPFEWSDIDWTVEQQVAYGDRVYVIYYTNNTDKDILELEINYVKKSDTTDEQMLDAFSDLRTQNDGFYDDDEIIDFGLDAHNFRYAVPGKTVDPSKVYAGAGSNRVTSEDQFNLFEPDIASIAYVDGERVYIVYYDFKNDKMSCDPSQSKPKYSWSDAPLAQLVPQPEYDIVMITSDYYEDSFGFRIYGTTVDDFNNYKQACIDAGFSENVDTDKEESYKAHNNDNVEFKLSYDEYGNYISCHLSMDEDETN